MISINTSSLFVFHHHQNRICNNNLRSNQEIMRTSEPALKKYKKVCKDFPNLSILTKTATPGEVQLKFVHASVGNKSLGESVAAFALEGLLDSPYDVLVYINIAFAVYRDKIRFPITEVCWNLIPDSLDQVESQIDSNTIYYLVKLTCRLS